MPRARRVQHGSRAAIEKLNRAPAREASFVICACTRRERCPRIVKVDDRLFEGEEAVLHR
jgi:hypothetical protein